MRKWARVFLKGPTEQWIDFPVANGSLNEFVRAVRMQGFIGPDGPSQAYVPLDQVRLILLAEGDENVVLLRPVPPETA